MDFIKQFKSARRVGVPLVFVRTADPANTMRLLAETLNPKKESVPIISWDVAHGFRPVNNLGKTATTVILGGMDASTSTKPTDALAMAEILGTTSDETIQDVVVFISNAHRFWADDQPAIDRAIFVQEIWNLRDVYKPRGHMLVLLGSVGSKLPDELVDDILIIDEPLPTAEQLTSIVRRVIADARDSGVKIDETPELLAKATDAIVGLSAFPAEQSVAMCVDIDKATLDTIELWERKRQAIEQTNGLSVHRGDETFATLGGIENAKDYVRQLIAGKLGFRVVVFIDEIEKAVAGTGTDTSGVKDEMAGTLLTWMQNKRAKGLLFLGPPGAAKSALAKAIGNEARIVTIIFDFAAMQSSFVGSSGARLRKGLAVIDAVSQGKALFVATCNSLDALSTELRRRFRNGTFFFDLPTADERTAIWQIYLKKFDIGKEGKQIQLPADDGWTGAEIEECCEKAYDLNISLVEAAKYIVPVAKSSPEKIRNLRQQANGKFISASKEGKYEFTEESVLKTGRKFIKTDADYLVTNPGQA